MDFYDLRMRLNVKKSYDVIVAGGGVAGVAAAVTAAQQGHSVLLAEKSNILGGLGTLGLVNFFVPMCNGDGKQIIFGLAEKWLRLSAEIGYDTIPDEWRSGQPAQPTAVRYTQTYSTYIFALQLLEEAEKAGVDVLYDCTAVMPVMEGTRCEGIITDSKSGLELYSCKYLIDTTGDADLLRRSGMPTVAGENFYSYFAKMITLDGAKRACESGDLSKLYGGKAYGGNVNLFGDHQPGNVPRWSGLTVEEVNDYLKMNQKELLKNVRSYPKGQAEIAQLPLMPNFRTTCRIRGEYSLGVEDCYRHFEDSIGAINDFEHRFHLFEVPYRALYNSHYPNMITAGRSADGHGYGWDLLRVIPAAILTGQAAGQATALALSAGTEIKNVDIRALQNGLEKQNVMIHFPDEYVPKDKSVVIHGKKLL